MVTGNLISKEKLRDESCYSSGHFVLWPLYSQRWMFLLTRRLGMPP